METKPVRKTRRLIRRIVLIAIALFLIILLALTIFTPTVGKNYLNKHGKELTGRTISVEKISYNYLTSTLRAKGARIFEPNDRDIFIQFDTLVVNMKPLRLLKHEINVQQFKIVNMKGRIVQNGSQLNFDDIIDFYSSGDTTSAPKESSTPYAFDLNKLEIIRGSISYTDQQINNTISIKDLSFLIPHLYWGVEHDSKADVSFELGSGGTFNSTLDYNMETGRYTGTAQLENTQLSIMLPYIQEFMRFSTFDGKLSTTIDFSGTQDDFSQFRMAGIARIDSLSVLDANEKKILGATRIDARLKEMFPLQTKAEVELVHIRQPYMYLELADSLFNFERMMVESGQSAAVDSTALDVSYQIYFDSLIVSNGLIDFSDHRFSEIFDYELSKVNIHTDDLALNADWVTFNASMLLNKRGNLEAQVGMNPKDPLQKIELNYVLSDFQLPDVNIYSKYYAGLPILFGDMYYVGKTAINDKKLDSNNELIIRNVELGRKTKGLFDIPIKLALFILKDINGDVRLNIPVTGDLSDPRTRVGKIVWDTFKQFMFKIVASPFKALGNLLGADPKELEEIDFIYNDTTLTGKQRRSLDLLLELEKVKPGLKVEMQYLNDRKLERTDAASEIAGNLYRESEKKEPSMHMFDYLRFLKNATGRDSLVVQDYEKLLAPAAEVDSMVTTREKQRMRLVRNYLESKSDSTQIRVLGYNPEDVLNIGSRPRFAIKYVLAEEEP